MTDWAAKVLEGVERYTPPYTKGNWIKEADALAAIARMGAGDGLVERATAALEGVTPGKPVQFHPSYCEEAKGAPFSEWDSSHDLSVILPDGKRYRIGGFRHAADAGFYHFTRQWVPEAAAHIAAMTAQVAEIQETQHYRYIGRDGKAVLARDLEDRAEAAEAKRDALTAQNREMALDVLASSGQAADAYAAQLAAEAERDALRDRVEKDAKAHEKEIAVWAENYAALERKVARLEGALRDMPKAVLHTTVCQGPQWPDDRPGVWLAALEACAKSVQAAVDAAIGEGGKDG